MRSPGNADGTPPPGLGSDGKFLDAVMDSQGRTYAVLRMWADKEFLGDTIPWPVGAVPPVAPYYYQNAVALVCFDTDGQMLWSRGMGCTFQLDGVEFMFDEEEQLLVSLTTSQYAGGGTVNGYTTPMRLYLPDTTVVWPLLTQQYEQRYPVFRINTADGTFDEVLFTRTDHGPDGYSNGKPIYRHGKFFFTIHPHEVCRLSASGAIEMRYFMETWPPGSYIKDYEVLPDTSVVIYGHTPASSIGMRSSAYPTNVYGNPAPSGQANSLWAARLGADGQVQWIRAYSHTDPADSQRGAEQVRLLPDGNLLLTAVHIEPVTFAGVTYGSNAQSMTKLLLLRIDPDGNEIGGLQLTNSLALPGGFSQDVHAPHRSWVVPEADGSIQFAHRTYGALALNGFTLPGLNQFSNAVVMGKISPSGEVVAADFVENVMMNPRLLVYGSRSVLLANHQGGNNIYRTLCLPNVTERQSVVMVVDHAEPKPLPVAEFTVQYLDQDGGMVRFNNTSTNGDTYTWVYGDNSPNGTLHSPVKGYNGGQNYTACLTAANMCGSAQACDNVVLGAPYELRPPSGVQNSTVQLVISDLVRAITTGTQFALVRTGMENIPLVNVQHSTTDAATSGGQHPFHTWSGAADLTDAPLGVWGLRIARPGQPADTLHAAFSVLANTGQQVQIMSLLGNPSTPEGNAFRRFSGSYRFERGGRVAHTDGYRILASGETPVGIPVISILPHAADLTRAYFPQYEQWRPAHTSYNELAQYRTTNGLELYTPERRDYVVTSNKAVRFQLVPQPVAEVATAYGTGFGPGAQANLHWRNEHYALPPVFGSDVLAGGTSVHNLIGLGQYLRMAAQDVLGMALGTPGCAPCFTQAEEQVMTIYALDIASLEPADPRFSFGEEPRIYDLREVSADVLSESMRTTCAPQLNSTTVDGVTFQRIVDRALERLLLHGTMNPCLPPVEPVVPGGPTPGSLLGNPRPPVQGPVLVGGGRQGGFSGPVFGAIPVSNPVATPPIPGLPANFWAPFEGVSTGEGTIVGTAVLDMNGETLTAPIEFEVEIAGPMGEVTVCPPFDEPLHFEGEGQHVQAEAGEGFYSSWIDMTDDDVSSIMQFALELEPSVEDTAARAAFFAAWDCLFSLGSPAYTTGMTSQQVEDKWNECLRGLFDAVNGLNAPYAPGDLSDFPNGFDSMGPNAGSGCAGGNTPQIRGIMPLPHLGSAAFADAFAAYNCSYDPNEKFGPGDNEEEIWVLPDHEFQYAISFENLPEASAPAQNVHVFDQLDTAFFDLSTVRITRSHVGIGTYFQPDSVPGGTQMRDLRPEIDAHLLQETHMDEGGLLRWDFTALDPQTLQPITDALGGFLPPNDTTGMGQGEVTFRVRLKENAPQGEFINNQASIVFDVNEPILTQVWRNKVDGIKPWSEVEELPAVIYTQQFNVDWQMGDSIGVVRHLELWVSVDGAPYHKIGHMEGSSVQLTGSAGHHYRFYTIAVDMAGNREEIPANGYDAETTIDESVGVGEEPTTASVGMLCFPNPTTDQLTLVLGEAVRGQQAMVHDAQGRLVHTQRLAGASTVLRTGHLVPGTYAITVVDPDGKRGSVRFVKE